MFFPIQNENIIELYVCFEMHKSSQKTKKLLKIVDRSDNRKKI